MSAIDILNAHDYITNFLHIRTKDGMLTQFTLNEPQEKLYSVIRDLHAAGKPIRIIILKARQMGFSTLTEGLIFHKTAVKENEQSLIVAHTDDATANIFKMSKRFFDNLDDAVRPMKRASNAKELIFENPTKNEHERKKNPGLRSYLRVATAGGHAIGRSATYNNVHISEYAFWPGDKSNTLLGILQAVPDAPDTMIVIESTAFGYDDFKKRWDDACAGRSEYVPVFFAWHEMREYRRPYDGFALTEEEKLLREKYGIDCEQLAWRRWCIAANCGGDVKKFDQEYPACPDDAFISTGECVFDTAKIASQRSKMIQPLSRGAFSYKRSERELFDILFEESTNGYIAVYEKPIKGHPYVIGADTSGEGSDYFAAHVLDNTNGKQVAVLHHRLNEDWFAEQLYCLGKYYNDALIGVETNFSTHPQRVLEALGYPRIYLRETFDTITKKPKMSHGFATTSKTRPVIIAELVTMLRDSTENIVDYDTLGEALTFCRNAHGRPEALPGEHDDLVMALAIANHMRTFQSVEPRDNNGAHKLEWTDDMIEDYYNSDDENKAYLESKWGTPKRTKEV